MNRGAAGQSVDARVDRDTPPPGVLRKDVILRSLQARIVRGYDSTGLLVAGVYGAPRTHSTLRPQTDGYRDCYERDGCAVIRATRRGRRMIPASFFRGVRRAPVVRNRQREEKFDAP
jgi:hypothetical protein